MSVELDPPELGFRRKRSLAKSIVQYLTDHRRTFHA